MAGHVEKKKKNVHRVLKGKTGGGVWDVLGNDRKILLDIECT
jgi:hypothetical protein